MPAMQSLSDFASMPAAPVAKDMRTVVAHAQSRPLGVTLPYRPLAAFLPASSRPSLDLKSEIPGLGAWSHGP